ncbi:RidA family protein [Oligoflexus tunisiensis]|uniref:RidA family protein n=1 Tax=Oligoflexus tunisiensis TaxID=708132 RepID=UPI000ACAB524|nr:RidA family protein [Oligoflexus tunisiensis]
MSFQRVSSGGIWEKKVGYCRALRAGNFVFVSGTAPVGEGGKVVAPGDAYRQARRCFEIVKESLAKLDCPLSAVVRTRMFVTDVSRWEEYGRAHQEFFGEYPPTTAMLGIDALVDPEMMIEVEVDAILPAQS